MILSELTDKAGRYLPAEKIAVIEDAYRFAEQAHEKQMRKSGDPYIEHPLQTAMILVELELDASSLAAALLHDVLENCDIAVSEIEAKFGSEVAKLVNATTKLGRLSWQTPEEVARYGGTTTGEGQAENLRKMLVAMAEDLRVVFIKLADRLHNMRTLDALSAEKQNSIARETLEIYAPLAHRLGIWELKWQLEDLSFRYLEPEKYHQVANLIADKRTRRESFIASVTEILKRELDRVNIKAEVSGRPKHLYSIYQKMERYAVLGKDFDDIHDLLALRVIVGTVPDCYSALGVAHSMWHPLSDHFNDYIATPKMNGYQSLHTTVMWQGTTPLEVQIRTREMHRIAEYGVAVHWRYKGGERTDTGFEKGIGWLRQLVEWHRELSGAEEFLESVRTDVFSDQVFVYTPKGEIKDLPKGSTPLDFAYKIHTDVGHRCIGAKVNGRLLPLDYQLNNGDVVQIMSSKGDRGPSRDWLNLSLGYVKTSHAKEKIRQWFKKQERTENVERGRDILEKLMRHLGIKFSEQKRLAELCGYDTLDEFHAAIGYGGITTHQIASKLTVEQEQPKMAEEIVPLKQPVSAVKVLGTEGILTRLAECCRPVPGDEIIGYVTRSRGITVHRQDCGNVTREREKERLLPVEWGRTDSLYPVNVQVEAWDRMGLMRDISTMVAEEKVNIAGVSLANKDDGSVAMYLALETKDLAQLSRLLAKVEGIRGVLNVTRVGDGASVKTSSST